MKCRCGAEIEKRVCPDKWFVADHVGKNGCGYWKCGFE